MRVHCLNNAFLSNVNGTACLHIAFRNNAEDLGAWAQFSTATHCAAAALVETFTNKVHRHSWVCPHKKPSKHWDIRNCNSAHSPP